MLKAIKLTAAFALVAVVFSGQALPSFGKPVKPVKIPAATGWNSPVLVHSDEAHRETSLAMSPSDPNVQIVCAPSGVPNTDYNQSYFHISHDAGRSWKPMRVEGGPTDARNYTFEGGDCDVAFDAGGTMYSADTWLWNLSVGHSSDAGKTWDGTPLAASGLVVDRPWLVGGPEGTVHITYQDLQCCTPSTIWYTRSTDFGKTFTPTTSVATAGPDGAFTWQGNLVVAPNQKDLYLVYSRRQGAAVGDLDDQGPETLWVAVSHDAGASWKSNLIASLPNPISYLYPSIGMDKGGMLHVVYSSKSKADRPVFYTFSKDKGESWSKPMPLLSGVAGFSPAVVGGPAGEAAVAWYGSPDPKAYDKAKADWYFYWAKVKGAGTTKLRISAGKTTTKPIFSGRSDIPEFETVRLDPAGRIHIGASAFFTRPDRSTGWAIYYQSER
ncbi:MAG: repeat-like domain [Actinomycetota bacterium]|jgi:hypothetical protein|nr:repeat-like domain [Actinomycetota bacterium]